VVRGEHDPAGRENDVEARVLEVHVFGVADLEVDLDPFLRRPLARRLDERGSKVLPDDVRAAPRGEDRDCARSRGRVEDPVARLRVSPLDDECVDVANGVRDPLVRPVAPDDALSRLQFCECHGSSWLKTP
jgi:hypothetical protein